MGKISILINKLASILNSPSNSAIKGRCKVKEQTVAKIHNNNALKIATNKKSKNESLCPIESERRVINYSNDPIKNGAGLNGVVGLLKIEDVYPLLESVSVVRGGGII